MIDSLTEPWALVFLLLLVQTHSQPIRGHPFSFPLSPFLSSALPGRDTAASHVPSINPNQPPPGPRSCLDLAFDLGSLWPCHRELAPPADVFGLASIAPQPPRGESAVTFVLRGRRRSERKAGQDGKGRNDVVVCLMQRSAALLCCGGCGRGGGFSCSEEGLGATSLSPAEFDGVGDGREHSPGSVRVARKSS